MSNLSKYRKSTVAILTALLIIAIAAPLVSFAAAAGAPTATLGTSTGPNGTLIKVSGAGFDVNQAVGAISITVDGLAGKAITTTGAAPQGGSATIGTDYRLKTDSNGVLTGYFIIYNLSPGAHTVMISDAGHSVVAGTFTITKPTVTISPASIAAGTSVTISASGFPTSDSLIETFSNKVIDANFSGNTITVLAGSYATTTSPTTLSSNKIATNLFGASLGTYTATVSLPAITAAGPIFNLTDAWNNVAGTTLSITTPTVTLTPSSGPVGTAVTATLSGFGPTATIVSVTVGNNASASPAVYTGATVTEQGTAALLFETPAGNANSQAGVAGARTVTVVDSLGNVGTATFTVTPKVTLTLGANGVNSATTYAPTGATLAQIFVAITGFKANSELTFTASPGIPTAWKTPSATWTIGVNLGSYSTTTQKISTNANGVAVFSSDMATAPTAAGQYSITISDGTNSISTIVTITTTGNIIAATPSSGAKGSTVTVTYFGTAAPAAITFDGVSQTSGALPTVQAWPTVSTNQVTFAVPTSASAGLHTIAATGFNSVGFTVDATSVTVVNPASSSVGTTVTIVGSGFSANTPLLNIQGASVTVASNTLVGSTLIVTFVVPNYIPGAYTLSLSDGTNTATTPFSVSSPSIDITPKSGTLGARTTIALTGSGFVANEAITVLFDTAPAPITAGTPVGLSVINTNGGMLINSGFRIPTSATAGAHTVTVMGASGAYATATFTVQPKIDSLPAVRPGAQVTLTGTGFAANSVQTLTVNDTATTWLNVGTTPATTLPAGTSVTTTTTGDLYNTVPVGFVVPTTETSTALLIKVTDAAGNSATTTLTILKTPTVVLGSSKVIAGTPIAMGVSINGTGFTPSTLRNPINTSPISAALYQGSTFVSSVTLSAATTTVSDTGSFPGLLSPVVNFVIPASVTPGEYTLQLTIGSAGVSTPVETASVPITVLGAPRIEAPTTAASGANVTITVNGLTAISSATFSSTNLVVAGVVQQVGTVDQFGGITVPNTGANAYAKNTWFIVPTGLFAGSYLLTLTDSNTGLTAQAAIQVTPSITLTPETGSKGTIITVTGTGFAASSTITAKVNGAAVVLGAGTTTSTATGAITTTFTIPVTSVATNTLTITDASGYTASAEFAVPSPVVQIVPSTAATGSTIQVIGSGFTPSSPIVIQVSGQVVQTVPTSLSANFGGDFITYITVPTGLSGNVTVTATDNSNNIGTATLTISGTQSSTSVPNQTTMSTTAQTTNAQGTATTTFTAGTSTVSAGFVLQTTGSPRDVTVSVTWQGPGGRVYNMAQFQTTMDSTARQVSFSNLIPAGVTGAWTVQLQVFGTDGTPLGVTTLNFTAQ